MGNSVKGFRFTGGYEDVFEVTENLFTYVEAEPFMWIENLACQNYERNADGTFSVSGEWYGMRVADILEMDKADMRTASEIVGIEFVRAYHQQNVGFPEVYDDPESDDTMGLMDVAACHVLETSGAPDVFDLDMYDHWRANFRQCISPDID